LCDRSDNQTPWWTISKIKWNYISVGGISYLLMKYVIT
jgi:hypothetical protein